MLVEFEKRLDSDFREGGDGGTFYIGTKGIKAGVGTAVEWNSANLRCTNVPAINHWIRRESRKGWNLPAGG